MAYRYSNTDKWGDAWFSDLSPTEKLLFIYLCDNCDIAGFIEVNYKIWSVHLGINRRGIEGALKGLSRGLIFSKEEDCIYLRNFLKHQKNLPLNQNNKAHQGIMRRFEEYSHKFDIQDIIEFIEGGSKGLPSPTGNGNGNGNGNGKDIKGECEGEKQKIITQQVPTLDEFRAYAQENVPSISISAVELKYKSWVENGWRDGKNQKVINWKSKLLNTLPYLQDVNGSLKTKKRTSDKLQVPTEWAEFPKR